MTKVLVFGMGGTIAGAVDNAADNVGYTAGVVAVADILGTALQGTRFASCLAGVEQVRQKDSKDMQLGDWWELARRVRVALERQDIEGVIITHGTDTLEEAAIFLSLVLDRVLQAKKPVVLTCAMRPATSFAPDGPQNVRDAFAVATDPHACGVLLVCAGKILAGNDLRKAHPYRIDAFESVSGATLGYVEEAMVRWLASTVPVWAHAGGFSHKAYDESNPVSVALVFSHSHVDNASVQALVSWAALGKLRGVVVAGTGNGSVHESLQEGLQQLHGLGVELVLTTRCMAGKVIGTGYGSRYQELCAAMTPFQARIVLMLALQSPASE